MSSNYCQLVTVTNMEPLLIQRVEYIVPPRFIPNPGASFVACVLMRDDRSEPSYYQLCAIEPLEAEDDDGNIVAVGPGEMFTTTGMDLDPFFGIGIKVEVNGGQYHIECVDPQYEPLLAPDFPNLPPVDGLLNGH